MKKGKVSESVLKRSILRQIKTTRKEVLSGAGVGYDCAIFAFSDKEAIASCMQEAAVRVEAARYDTAMVSGRMSMSQLLYKCANNLAASGATPVAVMITLLLPEAIAEPEIKQLMQEAEKICAELSIQITGGQSRVDSAVSSPFAIVTGYGRLQGKEAHTVQLAKPGQDVVISKWIGLEGTAILAKAYREKLLDRYPAYLVDEAETFDRYLSILPEAATAMKSGVCAMHDGSEGGIFATLWELAEGAGVGLTIDLKKLPIRQETVEVCECCNENPYELKAGGCLVMTSEDGLGLVTALQAEGIPAVVVGKVTDSKDRIIRNGDEVRFMDRPR